MNEHEVGYEVDQSIRLPRIGQPETDPELQVQIDQRPWMLVPQQVYKETRSHIDQHIDSLVQKSVWEKVQCEVRETTRVWVYRLAEVDS
jgi:hypothetical protein